MILAGEALPEQLGAFLMLLRIKEETGEEIAGFVRAARAACKAGRCAPGRSRLALLRRQEAAVPWYVLAALLLAQRANASSCTASTASPRDGSFPASAGAARRAARRRPGEAARHLERSNFAYLSLERIVPRSRGCSR